MYNRKHINLRMLIVLVLSMIVVPHAAFAAPASTSLYILAESLDCNGFLNTTTDSLGRLQVDGPENFHSEVDYEAIGWGPLGGRQVFSLPLTGTYTVTADLAPQRVWTDHPEADIFPNDLENAPDLQGFAVITVTGNITQVVLDAIVRNTNVQCAPAQPEASLEVNTTKVMVGAVMSYTTTITNNWDSPVTASYRLNYDEKIATPVADQNTGTVTRSLQLLPGEVRSDIVAFQALQSGQVSVSGYVKFENDADENAETSIWAPGVQVSVLTNPLVSIEVNTTGPVHPGDELTYTVVTTNLNQSSVIFDGIWGFDAGTMHLTSSSPGWSTPDIDGQTVTITQTRMLAPGEVVTDTFSYIVLEPTLPNTYLSPWMRVDWRDPVVTYETEVGAPQILVLQTPELSLNTVFTPTIVSPNQHFSGTIEATANYTITGTISVYYHYGKLALINNSELVAADTDDIIVGFIRPVTLGPDGFRWETNWVALTAGIQSISFCVEASGNRLCDSVEIEVVEPISQNTLFLPCVSSQ